MHSSTEASESTEFRVFTQSWWPTNPSALSTAYVGENACRKCHSDESNQINTPMGQAAFRSGVGQAGSRIVPAEKSIGPYRYRVVPGSHNSTLVVTEGKQSVTASIRWTFGAGVRGQTFILSSKGTLYDSQVSAFRGVHGRLAITPGHPPAPDGDLEKALGKGLSVEESARCFGCHTTASSTNDQFDPQNAVPGVQCEACHGPGLAHMATETTEPMDSAKGLILNPRSLSPAESVDFCGACHMTPTDVAEAGFFGANNVRFQPFRLQKSRCWGVRGDPRLVCTACHDPHQPLIHDASAYDQQCLSCHSAMATKSPANPAHQVCPKASANCTTCHMPKYDVPEMHAKFTDHFIRVVRDGEPYPNY